MGLITKGVMLMPLPDDPSEFDIVTWVQIKERMRDAGQKLDKYEDALELVRQHDPELADFVMDKVGLTP